MGYNRKQSDQKKRVEKQRKALSKKKAPRGQAGGHKQNKFRKLRDEDED